MRKDGESTQSSGENLETSSGSSKDALTSGQSSSRSFLFWFFVILVPVCLSIGFLHVNEAEVDEYSEMFHQFVEYVRVEFCTHGEIWCAVSVESKDGNFTTIESGKVDRNETLRKKEN